MAGYVDKSLAMAGYVDMKLDYSFKKIFSDMSILRNFLNDVLRGERTVEEVEPRNPEWQPESPDDRKVLVDVYCRSKDGTYFIVEMQYTDQKFFRDRALFTIAHVFSNKGRKDGNGDLRFFRWLAFMY